MSAHGQAGIVAFVGGLATINVDTPGQVMGIIAVVAAVAATILLVHWWWP